jgi:hypothetical protein
MYNKQGYIKENLQEIEQKISILKNLDLLFSGIPQGIKLTISLCKEQLFNKDTDIDFKYQKSLMSLFVSNYLVTRLVSKLIKNKHNESAHEMKIKMNQSLTSSLEELCSILTHNVLDEDIKTNINILQKAEKCILPISVINWNGTSIISKSILLLQNQLENISNYKI